MSHFDTIIRNGVVVDGTRVARYRADVAIKNGRIARVGGLRDFEADLEVDATGLIVAPGFIDMHTHYDSQIFWDPWCSISSWHGVTTIAIGNCGFGFAPCKPEDRDRAMQSLTRNEAVPLKTMQAGMPWDWQTFPEFLASLDRIPKGVNVMSYAPLAPLFYYVMGPKAAKERPPTKAELAEMCRLLEVAMEAGACGFSTQILGDSSHQRDFDGTPMVTDTMAEDDLLAFAGVLSKVGRGLVQGTGGTQELWNKVAEASGRPVLFNAVAISTDQHGVSSGDFRKQLEWMREASRDGQRIFAQAVTCDIDMEFTFEEWNLFDGNPIWREMTLGTVEERAIKFADPTRRQMLKEEFDRSDVAGSTNVAVRGGPGREGINELRVHWVKNETLKTQDYEGYTIAEIAKREGKHPIDALLDLTLADDLRAGFGQTNKMDLAAMKELASDPLALPGLSDGGAHTKFSTLGTYPTDFLIELVRDNQLLSLEEAHWHLSALPALAVGLRDRGYIQEGLAADLVIYDLDNLEIGPQYRSYDYPADEWRLAQKAAGYRWILVNGVVTFQDGESTGQTPGTVLRHGSARIDREIADREGVCEPQSVS